MTRLSIRYSASLTALFLTVGLLSACDETVDPPSDEPTNFNRVASELDRNMSPDVTQAEMDALVSGNHEFTLDLFDVLKADNDGNLLVSPLSIRIAFAMVYAGARGDTADEMAAALGYSLTDDRLHNAFNALDLALADRNDPGDGDEDDPVALYVANAFWGQTGYPFLDAYLDTLALNYGAGVHALDFHADPEAARLTINEWVEDRTRDRIKDLLPPGSIDASTAAVLTNALYLKAPWASKFEENMTYDQPFHLLGGGEVTVPMMHQVETFGYAEGEGFKALEMTYRLDELSMVLLLPDAGQFESFEDGLDAEQLTAIVDDLESQQVEISMPPFEFESEFTLKSTLEAMGMVIPFTGAADLSGMIEGGSFYISEAFHKTFIAVDEGGTEAAAATAVVINETSAPMADYTFDANRPFLFLIRDRVTGSLLFFGRVVDPS